MKRKITAVGANLVFATIVISYFTFEIILFILGIFIGLVYGREYVEFTVMDNMLFSTLAQYVLVLFPVLLYTYIKKMDLKEVFRLNRLKLEHIFIIIPIATVAYFAGEALNTIYLYFLQFIIEIPGLFLPVPKTTTDLIVGIFTVAVTPAVCEEFLHRGLLLKAYESRGSIRAVVITSLFFVLFHFDITNAVGVFFSGLLFGYIVVRTNSIYSSIIAHFINNAIAELLLYWNGVDGLKFTSITTIDVKYSLLYLFIGTLIIYALLKLLVKTTHLTYKPKPAVASIRSDFYSILTHWPVIVVIVLYFFSMFIYL